VAEAQKRLDQIKEYRNKLAAVLDASTKGASELQGKYRAFRDEAKSFERTVNTLSKVGPTTAFEAPTLKALGKDLDGLAAVCTKHMPMAHDDNLAFQLAVDPPAWCALPPKRAELFLTLANNAVKRDVGTWTKLLQEMRTGLSKGQGFVSFPGNFLEELVMNRDATREKTLTQYKAIYAAAQAAPPSTPKWTHSSRRSTAWPQPGRGRRG
jgi:hypothetical protein